MISSPDSQVPGDRLPRTRGWGRGLVVVLLVVLMVAGVAAFVVLQRRPVGTPAVSPSPAVADDGDLNPFAAAEVSNPLEGAAEENPFYVNPFAQYKEPALEENAPAANPFGVTVP